jgi:selenocysteine lyase/cysteine desulfurase
LYVDSLTYAFGSSAFLYRTRFCDTLFIIFFQVNNIIIIIDTAVSMKDLDADFYGFSFYKLMGPHASALCASPELLESLENDKLLPSSNIVPERFEYGTLPYEMMAGCVAAVDFISNMAPADGKSRREKIVNSMNALEAYEHDLFQELESGLLAIPGVRTYGHASVRTPTIYFTIDGIENDVIYKHLASKKINAPASNFYALEVSRALGLGDKGAVRAGLAPYSSIHDVQRLLTALIELSPSK